MNSQRSLLKCFDGAEFIFVGRTHKYRGFRWPGQPEFSIYMFVKLTDGRNIFFNTVDFRSKNFIKVSDPTELAEYKSNMDYLLRHIYEHNGEVYSKQLSESYESRLFNREDLNFDFDVFDCDTEELYKILDERGLT